MKIKVEKLTETEKKLYEMLLKMWDDTDFLVGALNSLVDDEEREEVIEFIESNEDVTASQITLLTLDISQSRDNIIMDAFFKGIEEIAKEL